MREKLDSDQGKAIYSRRKHIVEPFFGQIKSVMGFTSFLLRGLKKVRGEFSLVAIAHNLRKIWLIPRWNPFERWNWIQKYVGIRWLQFVPFA